jgi:prepilin-type N-terminal cleavage/methylation domain-containing protein
MLPPVLADNSPNNNNNKTMKNTKLHIRKLAKAGFSLIEMLVVIAVIGVIAAIAIPNIGKVNDSAKEATARRNAQSVASVAAAAVAAGVPTSGWSDTGAAYDAIADGVSPTTGAFSGKQFRVPNLPTATDDAAARTRILGYLSWDSANASLNYTANAVVNN